MLLTNAPNAAPPSPATPSDAVAGPDERTDLRTPEPLRGRALLAQLEQLAQVELARLTAQGGLAGSPCPFGIDRALIGLAWDLGLCGDAVVTTPPDPIDHPSRA